MTGGDCLFQEFAVVPGESYTLQCEAKGELTQEAEMTSTGYQRYAETVAVPATGAIGTVTFYSEDTGVFDACSVVQE